MSLFGTIIIAEDGTYICGDHGGHQQYIYSNVPKVDVLMPGNYYL